ncbi:MAG: Cof subfamily protein (haloacid dehalogenase superfamily) [Verrucomicrobiales bacterium]|jgi:Cof subfamily protein (haloacid dehalogenase superfamily)
MLIDALITDLDGTFWSPGMEVHQRALEVVGQLDARDIPFVIATGRRALGAIHGLEPAGLADRPAILMNGALARDNLRGPSFLVDAIPTERAVDVLSAFRRGGLEPVAYVDDASADMLVGPGSSHGGAYLAKAVGFSRVNSLDDAIEGATVIGFGAFGHSYELLEPIANRINDEALATAIIGVSHFEGDHGIMIQEHEVDKQTGIEAWCARANIDVSRLAVVGDGHNDIEMLRAAKIAIVPSNAPEEIRKLANAIIPPNEEGGWEQIPSIIGL